MQKCANREGSELDEREADLYNDAVESFSPSGSTEKTLCASLSNAISLINRYCAKLPSDTFTKLTPLYSMNQCIAEDGTQLYACSLRLPINSPVKQTIMVILLNICSHSLLKHSLKYDDCNDLLVSM